VRADGQKTVAQVRIDPAVVLLIGRQPFGQQRVQPAAAGLKGLKPNRLQHRQRKMAEK